MITHYEKTMLINPAIGPELLWLDVDDHKVVAVVAWSSDMTGGRIVTSEEGYSAFCGKSEEELIDLGFIPRLAAMFA